MAELYTLMQNNTDITPLAGTTGLLKDCHTDRFLLPESILFLKNLPELETIAKRERFIDFGAAATLNTILELGEKNVPQILYQAISLAANPGVRSLATIGGNIAHAKFLPYPVNRARYQNRNTDTEGNILDAADSVLRRKQHCTAPEPTYYPPCARSL